MNNRLDFNSVEGVAKGLVSPSELKLCKILAIRTIKEQGEVSSMQPQVDKTYINVTMRRVDYPA